MYNIVCDCALVDVIAVCRIPCSCVPCMTKRKEHPSTRYVGPRDTCVMWEIFKIDDDHGYNDWKMVLLKQRKDCLEVDVVETMGATLCGLGWTLAQLVKDGGYGGYIVDDDNIDYYLVKWVGLPWEVEADEIIQECGAGYPVFKGEMICKGIWLDKLRGARNWYTPTTHTCIVRMQQVVNADLQLNVRYAEYPLRRGLLRVSVQLADTHGAWHVTDLDHEFMIEESRRREGFDYEELIDEEELAGDNAGNGDDDDNNTSDSE